MTIRYSAVIQDSLNEDRKQFVLAHSGLESNLPVSQLYHAQEYPASLLEDYDLRYHCAVALRTGPVPDGGGEGVIGQM